MKADVVIVAAGKGRRFQSDKPKQFLHLAGKPILARTINVFDQHPLVGNIIIVGSEDWLSYVATDIVTKYNFQKVTGIVAGKNERQASVHVGVDALESSSGTVLIHDGVRPLVSSELISRAIDLPVGADANIPVIPCTDTVKEIDGDWIKRTIPRDTLRLVQTPQAFRIERLRHTLEQAKKSATLATDEATLIERAGGRVKWFSGDIDNIKITTELDLKLANLILESRSQCE